MKLLAGFIETLKSNKLYDESMIIIVSDHGYGHGEVHLKTDVSKEMPLNRLKKITPKIKARAVPLVLGKPFKNRGEIKLSMDPVALSQIPELIFKELNLDISQPVDSSEYGLKRRYLLGAGTHKNPNYFVALYEYQINGLSWLDESWEHPRKIYIKKGRLVLVNDIKFNPKGNFQNYLVSGKLDPQNLFKPGSKFSLLIPVNEEPANFMLKVLTDPMFKPQKNELNIPNNQSGLRIDFETSNFDEAFNKIYIYCNEEKAFEIKIKKNKRLNAIKLYSRKDL